nr:hypothetical protein [Tanacetum cinerariifolium]
MSAPGTHDKGRQELTCQLLIDQQPFSPLVDVVEGMMMNVQNEGSIYNIRRAGSKSYPPMLNKENYVPWSSHLLRYPKSRPNGKLIHNSIINGPYVRRMIPETGDTNWDVPVNETFHVQTDYELTEKELK